MPIIDTLRVPFVDTLLVTRRLDAKDKIIRNGMTRLRALRRAGIAYRARWPRLVVAWQRRPARVTPAYAWFGGAALGGAVSGAAAMYWFDPQSGRRRRALARDRSAHLLRRAEALVDAGARDLAHRVRGRAAEIAARLESEPVDDVAVERRLRSELGRVTSHPGAITVSCDDGIVELTGLILEDELPAVLARVAKVRGVRGVENRLEVPEQPGSIPALQGGVRRQPRFEYMQAHWAPGPRVVALATGVSLIWIARRQSPMFRWPVGLSGVTLVARSISNVPLRRLVGLGVGPAAVDIAKDLHVNASVDEVFDFWRAFENFPRFMTHVKEVRPVGGGRYRWKVEGPLGIRLGWEAELTEEAPKRRIAWRSVDGAAVKNAGAVDFEPSDGGTHVRVRMQYTPPAGAIGHAFAKLLGRDPKREMDDDLMRFKSLIEHSKATGDGETVTKQELAPHIASEPAESEAGSETAAAKPSEEVERRF